MKYIGDYYVDDYITFGVQLHRFSSGAVYAPTGSVTYTFYENNSTSGAPTGGNLAQLNSKTGLYTARVQLTNANGFEAGKEYLVHIEATVDSVAAAELQMFRVIATLPVDVTKIAGSAVSTSTAQLGVNVVNFGGAAGTFASGRPEVNTTHAAGTAWGSGAITAASIATDAITAAKIAADAIGASELAADAVTEIQSGLATSASISSLNNLSSAQVDMALSNYGALKPTVAGRTLDVSAGGEAGVDWANVGSPTTTVGLSGTTVKTATDVETDTADIQTRLPAALVSGRMDSNMQAAGTGVITATVIATDAITDAEISAAACNKISDHVHRRNTSNIEASANGDTLDFKSGYGAIALQTHNKDASSGTALVVKKSDDTTNLVSLTVTTDAGAGPITGITNP